MDIYGNIIAGDYNSIPFEELPENKCYSCGVDEVLSHNLDEMDNVKFCKNCGARVKEIYDERTNLYVKNSEEATRKNKELKTKFKEDVIRYAGLEGHEKADQIFKVAWDLGREVRFRETLIKVAKTMGAIAPLFKE